jgi:hypothetical protein
MPKQVNVECAKCHKVYEKPLNRFNEAIKYGSKQYCSIDCKNQAHSTGVKKNCSFCNKEIVVLQAEIRKSKSGNFFCNRSCFAKVVNIGRTCTNETKKKISDSLVKKIPFFKRKKIFSCQNCGNEIAKNSNAKLFCSKQCSSLFRDKFSYSKEEVIIEIIKSYKELTTTPSSKLNIKLTNAAKRHFGSWNKAVIEAGLPINQKWMVKKNLLCKDGHKADSISEMLLDNWFYKNNIPHERYRKYPSGKYTCDFYLPNKKLYVEYFGLIGSNQEYDLTVETKRRLAVENNLILVEITCEDLYPTILLKKENFI